MTAYERDNSRGGVSVKTTPKRSVYEDRQSGGLLATVEPDARGWLARCYVSPDYVEDIPSTAREAAEYEAASHAQVVSDVLHGRTVEPNEGPTP